MRARYRTVAAFAVTLALAVPVAAQQTAPLREPDVIFVPTPAAVVTGMLKLAKVSAKDVVYDLGCGDGMIITAAAKEFGATAVGIDINPVRVKEANERVAAAGVKDKVTVVNDDLFTHDISKATVVTLYLLPSLNEKLIPKLNKELKPGTRVVSQSFHMGTNGAERYPAEQEIQVEGRPVYLWTIPIKEKK